MARKLILTMLVLAASSACNPAVPTLSPALATQGGATALAAANAMLTATREAIPTRQRPTPVPPPQTPPGIPFVGTSGAPATGIPVTGPTAIPSAASPIPVYPATLISPAPTATLPPATGAAVCNHLLDVASAGPKIRLIIRNDTRGPITFSMGLGAPNSFGQCGYLAWSPIPKSSKLVVQVPQTNTASGDACYWAYAVVSDLRNPTTVSQSGFCLTPSKRWAFDVAYNRISLSAP